jgi:hypothetical protein
VKYLDEAIRKLFDIKIDLDNAWNINRSPKLSNIIDGYNELTSKLQSYIGIIEDEYEQKSAIRANEIEAGKEKFKSDIERVQQIQRDMDARRPFNK